MLARDPSGDLLLVTPSADLGRADRNPVRVFLTSRQCEQTRGTMQRCLERLATILDPKGQYQLDELPWHQLTFAHTSAMRAALINRYSPNTVLMTLSALRGVLRTAYELELMTAESFHRATSWPKLRAKRLIAGRDLSVEEVEQLQDYCEWQNATYGAFLSAIFALLFGAGIRASELVDLAVHAYDRPAREIRLLRKGNKEESLALGDSECEVLDRWLGLRKSPTTWLFPRVSPRGAIREKKLSTRALQHIFAAVAKDLNFKHFSPHDCRRTYCTRLLQAGLDVGVVQRLMSHERPDTTIRYDRRTHHSDAEKRRQITLWRIPKSL